MAGFIGRETFIKVGPAVKNKFHKHVGEIITWENMVVEISIVFLNEKKKLVQYCSLQTESLIVEDNHRLLEL